MKMSCICYDYKNCTRKICIPIYIDDGVIEKGK